MSRGPQGVRYAEIEREFDQARVQIVLDIDGGSKQDVATGLGFFDHVLRQLGHYGFLNLGVKAEGDVLVDDLHTIVAVGTTLGRAFRETLRGSEPVTRFSDSTIALEDSLVNVAVDLEGKGRCLVEVKLPRFQIGECSVDNLLEFFSSFCSAAGVTVHIRQLSGENAHYTVEAIYIAFGVALNKASRVEEGRNVPTLKGNRV